MIHAIVVVPKRKNRIRSGAPLSHSRTRPRKHPTCNHLNMEARTFEFARHPKTGGGKTKAPRDESARNLVRNPKGANMATASVR